MLSVCMIVKDEEQCIVDALASVQPIADEIIVVDTGSQDKTKDKARLFTDKIFDFPWNNDFSEARNFSLSKASGSWILCLDADEVISAKDHHLIQQLVQQPTADAYYLLQRTYTKDPLTSNITSTYKDPYSESSGYVGFQVNPIIRLFRNLPGVKFQNPIHETTKPSLEQHHLKIMITSVPIHHFPSRQKQEKKDMLYEQLGKIKLDAQPDDAKAFAEHARRLIKKGELSVAISLLEKSISLDKENEKAAADLIACYTTAGQIEKAELLFKKYQEKKACMMNMAILYENQGKEQEALGLFKKILAMEKRSIQALFGCATIYYKIGNYKESFLYLKETLTYAKNHPLAWNLLAKINLRNKDEASAKKYFLLALQYLPSDPDTLFNLAQLALREKKNDEALHYLNQAQDNLPPKHPLEKKILEQKSKLNTLIQQKQS